jgi:dienelactone hydrolase
MTFPLTQTTVTRTPAQPACRHAPPVGPHPAYGTLTNCRSAPGGASYYLHRPPGDLEGAPVLVVVHGISRNVGEHIRAFGNEAARQGFVTIAPRFSRHRFPGYQRLGHCRDGSAPMPDVALREILDEVHEATGADTSRVFLFGFSGGAQFAHRFALCSPGRVKRLVLGSAGWYTFPDAAKPFPRGIGPAPLAEGYDLAHLLRVPTLVVVGEQDTLRDGAFNASRRLDVQQGPNRVERGRRWVAAMQAAAGRAQAGPQFSFATLPGCGHNFRQCVAAGGIVPVTLEFFLRSSRRATIESSDANLPLSHLMFSAGTAD